MAPLGVILIAEDVPMLRRGVARALDWAENRRLQLFKTPGDD